MLRPGVRGASLIVAASAFLSVAIVSRLSFLGTAELRFRDILAEATLGTAPQSADVTLVEINDQTLEGLPYREPTDRKFLRDLLTRVAAAKPRAILLDLLFDLPTEPAKDEELQRTISELQVPLVVSFIDDPKLVDAKRYRYEKDFVPPGDRALPDLEDAGDGVTRFFGPGRETEDGKLPSVPYALLAKLGVTVAPQWTRIAWRSPPAMGKSPFRIITAQELLAVDHSGLLDHQIVVIGGNLSLRDRCRTPIDPDMPCATALAHAIDQLADNRSPPASGFLIDLLFTVGTASIGAAIAFSKLRLRYRLACGAMLPALFIGIAFGITAIAHMMPGVVAACMAFMGAMWAGEAVRASDR